eukprot:652069-Ditylum_brightwellii.AAC.1
MHNQSEMYPLYMSPFSVMVVTYMSFPGLTTKTAPAQAPGVWEGGQHFLVASCMHKSFIHDPTCLNTLQQISFPCPTPQILTMYVTKSFAT